MGLLGRSGKAGTSAQGQANSAGERGLDEQGHSTARKRTRLKVLTFYWSLG